MKLILQGHDFRYEMLALCLMYFTAEKIDTIENGNDYTLGENENIIFTTVEYLPDCINLSVRASVGGRRTEKKDSIKAGTSKKDTEMALARLLYYVLSLLFGHKLQWGVMTGIRPVKLVRELRQAGKSDSEISEYLKHTYLISEDKLSLIMKTATFEQNILSTSTPDSFSLYISIPFCPSRCSYCSFVSHSIEKSAALTDDYTRLLIKEIAYTGQIVRSLGLHPKTVYYGGGTPTALRADQLEMIMKSVNENFDLSGISEYTVEAGRPDTITVEKLDVIKKCGADRISINPQTFHDNVLEAIGRKHTTEQTLRAYELAKKTGFKTINMDLIAGLESDTLEGFCSSLDTAVSLSPQNITVHTLSIKRAADLMERKAEVLRREVDINEMISYSKNKLSENKYHPYYLYRQKNTVGCLENTGYSVAGHDGAYNVFIMDEAHSIIALGGGGVTKLCAPHLSLIRRVPNYKYPLEYIKNFENILLRKDTVRNFYKEFPV